MKRSRKKSKVNHLGDIGFKIFQDAADPTNVKIIEYVRLFINQDQNRTDLNDAPKIVIICNCMVIKYLNSGNMGPFAHRQ